MGVKSACLSCFDWSQEVCGAVDPPSPASPPPFRQHERCTGNEESSRNANTVSLKIQIQPPVDTNLQEEFKEADIMLNAAVEVEVAGAPKEY